MMRITSWAALGAVIAVGLAIALWSSTMPAGDELTRTAAHRLNWPVSKTSIYAIELDGLEGCAIYNAHDVRVLDDPGLNLAGLKDGSWIVSSEPDALDKVFARCASPHVPAGTLAELVARFGYGGLSVLHDSSLSVTDGLLKKAGRKFASPEISIEQGTPVIRFLALSTEGSRLFQLKARIGAHVSVDSPEELASQ